MNTTRVHLLYIKNKRKNIELCFLEIIICARFLLTYNHKIWEPIRNRFIYLSLSYVYYGIMIELSSSNFSFFLFLTIRTKRTSILLSFMWFIVITRKCHALFMATKIPIFIENIIICYYNNIFFLILYPFTLKISKNDRLLFLNILYNMLKWQIFCWNEGKSNVFQSLVIFLTW